MCKELEAVAGENTLKQIWKISVVELASPLCEELLGEGWEPFAMALIPIQPTSGVMTPNPAPLMLRMVSLMKLFMVPVESDA